MVLRVKIETKSVARIFGEIEDFWEKYSGFIARAIIRSLHKYMIVRRAFHVYLS